MNFLISKLKTICHFSFIAVSVAQRPTMTNDRSHCVAQLTSGTRNTFCHFLESAVATLFVLCYADTRLVVLTSVEIRISCFSCATLGSKIVMFNCILYYYGKFLKNKKILRIITLKLRGTLNYPHKSAVSRNMLRT